MDEKMNEWSKELHDKLRSISFDYECYPHLGIALDEVERLQLLLSEKDKYIQALEANTSKSVIKRVLAQIKQ